MHKVHNANGVIVVSPVTPEVIEEVPWTLPRRGLGKRGRSIDMPLGSERTSSSSLLARALTKEKSQSLQVFSVCIFLGNPIQKTIVGTDDKQMPKSVASHLTDTMSAKQVLEVDYPGSTAFSSSMRRQSKRPELEQCPCFIC